MSLKADGLRKSYGEKVILNGASIEVPPSSVVALVGPNGSGKSTLLRALCLVDPPDTGAVSLDGREMHFDADSRAARVETFCPQVTLCFQQHFLWPHLSLRMNILMPLRLLGRKNAEAACDDVIELLKMREFAGRHPNEVSLGQRQRGALARSLALDPEYLLLDEPTASLDPDQARIIWDVIGDLPKRDVGILIVTHDIGRLADVDRVFRMVDGRVIAA